MEEPKPTPEEPFEKAVVDAQLLVAYAAGKCKNDIDEETLTTLIAAKRYMGGNQSVDAKSEAEFWMAYQKIWKLVTPATPVSIKATGSDAARRTVSQYSFLTVFVLIVVLILQIYWVIGNQLTAQLAELLKREIELSQEISANRDEYIAIEMRFKQSEWDSESFKTNGVYTFYSSPDWERDTFDNLSAKAELETDLASIKSQLERNSSVLLMWSHPWKRLIEQSENGTKLVDLDQYGSQIDRIDRQIMEIEKQLDADPDGSKRIEEAENKIDGLQKQLTQLQTDPIANAEQISSLRSQLESLTNWVNQPGLADQIVSQLNQDIERLKEEQTTLERQKQGDINREISRQAQLAAQFALVILQSYLLPLLYGILGARTFVLRSLSKEIEDETFSGEKRTQHVLRVSLGALAGILVGWFSFLIPDETTTFVGSISPLAIAFLVGYNIELFFAMMDRALFSITERLQRSSSPSAAEPKTKQLTSSTQQPPLGEAAG